MNRSNYFDYIEEKLSILATRVELRGKLNILDLHLHSEDFYADFFNLLFNWELKNLNAIKQNVEGIDLIDLKNKIVIQVSATATKQKIESALSKDILNQYGDFDFKFISISKDADDLKKKSFKNPYNLNFIPSSDIYDIHSILRIMPPNIDKQKIIYEFIKKELGSEPDRMKVETNLAAIINILAKENLNQDFYNYQSHGFEIERKIEFNDLNNAKLMVDDYISHHIIIENIYSEFDKLGVNKSLSVLSSIRKFYVTDKKLLNADELFFKIIENLIDKIQNSSNYEEMPYDELELCVNILVVDAFIRCKIFENPNGYNYVATR